MRTVSNENFCSTSISGSCPKWILYPSNWIQNHIWDRLPCYLLHAYLKIWCGHLGFSCCNSIIWTMYTGREVDGSKGQMGRHEYSFIRTINSCTPDVRSHIDLSEQSDQILEGTDNSVVEHLPCHVECPRFNPCHCQEGQRKFLV